MNRSKLVLFLLVCVLAVAVVVAWFRMPRQKSVEQLTVQQGTAGSSERVSRHVKPVELRFDLLDQKSVTAVVKKDVFTPVGNGQITQVAGTQEHQASVAPLPPMPPPTPLEIARKQLEAFTVIGSYIKKNRRIVFLSKGEEISAVHPGDVLIPGYSVVAIQDDQLKLRSDDGKHELILAL